MTLTIDGRQVTFEGRLSLLDVARANGVFVPSLCDHPALEPFGACRLCLVEIQGQNRCVPACSTLAEDGMVVLTATPKLLDLRRGVLELILAEHPHACLICAEKSSCDDLKSTIRKTDEVTGCVLCPENGRCELQRVAAAMGLDLVNFPSRRRPGEVRRDDPFIDRDNSLCILCGRCVRVCREVRGADVLTFVSRGSATVVGTALDRRLLDSGCRFCGACVDVCPTGSFSERAVRYDRRPDEERKLICPLCAQGCRLTVDLRGGRVVGAAPDPDGPVNHGQACVRGRFLVRSALSHSRRLLEPLIRENGALRPASWDEALTLASTRLSTFRPGEIAVTGSAQGSCEDTFVLGKLAAEVFMAPGVEGTWAASAAAALRSLGRAAGQDVPLNFRIADIGSAENIVVIGEDLPVTEPIVGLAVHKASAKGAAVTFVPAGKDVLEPGLVPGAGRPALFLFGRDFVNGKEGLAPLVKLWNVAARSGGRLIPLDAEANIRGGLEIAGASPVPSSRGRVRALYIAGPHAKLEPGEAEFVIVQASYGGETIDAADIVLPEATSFETEGAFVNVEGRIQVSSPAVEPPGRARPGWRIVAALAEKLGAAGFAFESAAAVRAALRAAAPAFAALDQGRPADDAFIAEKPAEGLAGIDGRAVAARLGPRPGAAAPGPDLYKGLDLARENKSLKLVRGRR